MDLGVVRLDLVRLDLAYQNENSRTRGKENSRKSNTEPLVVLLPRGTTSLKPEKHKYDMVGQVSGSSSCRVTRSSFSRSDTPPAKMKEQSKVKVAPKESRKKARPKKKQKQEPAKHKEGTTKGICWCRRK
jgi:hypothetical protein